MKKNFFKFFALVATAAMFAIACDQTNPDGPDGPGKDDPTPTPEVTITVTPAEAEVIVGETVTLTAQTENFEGTVTWSSDKPEIATVAEGVVTGVAEGTATITATAGEKSATATITVNPVPGPTVQTVAMKYDYKNCYNYVWDEAIATLPAFTMEWKFKADSWHGKNNEVGICNRLAAIENKSENGVMLRFNDGACWGSNNSKAVDGTFGVLQVCSFLTDNFLVNVTTTGSSYNPTYNYNTKFTAGNWYTVSITWDGNEMNVYVDGELAQNKAASTKGKGQSVSVERFELGMSWWEGGGHDEENGWPARQGFDGYLAYARVWNAVLPTSQIKENLCYVTNAENLVANWVFDTYGEHTVKDYAAGNKNTMDFSKASDMDGATVLNTVDCSETFEAAWVEFEDGICPEIAAE